MVAALSPQKPDVPRPGIVGMRGSISIRLRPCMIMGPPPPPDGLLARLNDGRDDCLDALAIVIGRGYSGR